MDQDAILATMRETITQALENTLRDGRVVVFYRTPNMNWSANTVFTPRFLNNQAQLMASHATEGQKLTVSLSQGLTWPEITLTLS